MNFCLAKFRIFCSSETFVPYYNEQRVHKFLDNLKPVDVDFGRSRDIKALRSAVKEQTLELKRKPLGQPSKKIDQIYEFSFNDEAEQKAVENQLHELRKQRGLC